MNEELTVRAEGWLKELCVKIGERPVGSRGNLRATDFFMREMASMGWETSVHELAAMDWSESGAALRCGSDTFQVRPSPYSRGCSLEAEMTEVSALSGLEAADISGRIVLLHGEIAREQIMPKNFIFYNPEDHRKIVSLLEAGGPLAIICATGRNSALAGGPYPFPMIEDGDFDIPSVYMTQEEGARLLLYAGEKVTLVSGAERIPSRAYNVTASKGVKAGERIVITAHIDAKKGTPGAIDNGTGVVVLLLAALLLRDYSGGRRVEIVALNGEDYYAVPGQMDYISRNRDSFNDIALNINIDGAGYHEDISAISFYGVPDEMRYLMLEVIGGFEGIKEGIPWPQGDHSIFAYMGRPAVAFTSRWFPENMNTQTITHTEKDGPEIVDCSRLPEIATAIAAIVRRLG